MKIIDLLNKIAKGEESDTITEFAFDGRIWNFFKFKDSEFCLDEWLLNQEIVITKHKEIIEEENKIPEKLDIRQEKNIKNNWKWKIYGKEHSYNISTPQKIIADKLNEVLDYLESKGE